MNKNGLRHTMFLCAAAAAMSLAASCSQDGREEASIRGSYAFEADEYFDDGIECDIHVEGRQTFGLWGLDSEADLMLGFKFNDSFEFNDMVLHYHVSSRGDWSYTDSLITISVDSSDVDCHFVDSNAQAYVEQTMVRYLRKYVRDSFIPEVQRRLLFVGVDSICLDEVTDTTLILSRPIDGRTLLMHRVGE